jgi:hypothetical protein
MDIEVLVPLPVALGGVRSGPGAHLDGDRFEPGVERSLDLLLVVVAVREEVAVNG